jgi:hypothetical protein
MVLTGSVPEAEMVMLAIFAVTVPMIGTAVGYDAVVPM